MQNLTQMKIKELENLYFSLLPKETKKEKYSTLTINVGDWLYSNHFKTVNKVKEIKDDSVYFYFDWSTNKDGYGSLKHFTNSDGIGQHRKATKKEVKTKLVEEINKITKKVETQI